jgi:hypothetical protein
LYRLIFNGRGLFQGMEFVLTYEAPTTATQDERRRGLSRTLRRGLVTLPNMSTEADRLTVDYEIPDEEQEGPQGGVADDPWNRWVFEVGGSGDLELEASQREYGVEGNLEAERVTEIWKLEFRLDSEYEVDVFEREENEIRSISRDTDFDGEVVRSIGEHWAVGLASTAFTRTFTNTDLAVRARPALEYNVFPYAISDEKELTFTYYVGPEYRDYSQETIFGKRSQWTGRQSLRIGLDLDRPWGSVFSSLTGSHYFHDLSKNRVQFNNFLYVRLVEGLNLRFQFGVEFIQDQLHLPRGDVPLEEVLLRRQDLATDYELDLSVGLSYTFGSIYNNVVNTRL